MESAAKKKQELRQSMSDLSGAGDLTPRTPGRKPLKKAVKGQHSPQHKLRTSAAHKSAEKGEKSFSPVRKSIIQETVNEVVEEQL
jgi:hypothetical protein